MLPFYALIACALLLATCEFIFDLKLSFIYYLFVLILIVFAGTRQIGIDPDSDNYVLIFENYADIDVVSGSIANLLYEPVSKLVFLAVHKLGFGVGLVFFLYASISIAIKGAVVRQVSPLPWLSLYLFSSHFFLYYEMVQIRAGLAMSVALVACLIYGQSKRWSYWVLILASCIHVSALLGVAFYLFKFISINLKKYMVVLSVSLAFATVFILNPDVFLGLLSIIPLDKVDDYMDVISSYDPANIFGITIVHLAPCLLGLWLIDNGKIVNKLEVHLIHFYALCIPYYWLFLPISVMAYRSSEFFQVANIVVIPILIRRFGLGWILFPLTLMAGLALSYFTLEIRELFPIGYASWLF